MPDLSIEQALPLGSVVSCIVIPSNSVEVRRLDRDPRVRELLRLAQANQALVVIGAGSAAVLADTGLIPLASAGLLTFLSSADLFTVADDLVSALSLIKHQENSL